MTVSPFDTVAAVSTPYGKGGVAVIRLSGDQALTVAERIFFPLGGKKLTEHPSRTAVYGLVRDPEDDRVLDDALCTTFRGPHSFTGEDTAEIACHGGVLVTRNILEACLRAGARQALAGEFTRRAYLNGKLDLERAEALGNLLDAGNDEQVKLARAGMNGLLTSSAEAVYSDLMAVLANMEAGMDFPEEDLTEMPLWEIREAIDRAEAALKGLVETYRTGHAIAEGIPTVICGRPNVGKSAFYNRLVGREAAIVTDIAGTTRDVLTDTVSLGRVTLRLSDTAGLRESDDPVEMIGVKRAKQAMDEAELVLILSESSGPDSEADELAETLSGQGKTVLRVYTKGDLAMMAPIPDGAVCVSSVTGEGFDALREAVERAFIDGNLRMGEEAVVFSARQAAALRETAANLHAAAENLDAGLPYDICADDIRAAMSELGSLCGREMGEDVLTEIFSRFCVGK
ncbi:MAG: tRNA uridine-5-carboxymethylaminomethyl(34) synthesis GTPase MnmE [Ruminococcaceae bacterium]|nr:tRNA uridine-5-carboxymethylaminomethyl(34) synthesis GTPase MnmE [Oscillospiraceae bacterium]